MKALAVLWLTAALSAAAASEADEDSSRLPSRTELETVSRRDLISLFPKYVDLSAKSRQIGENDDGGVLEVFDVFMEFVCYPPYLTYCLFCTSTWFFTNPACQFYVIWICFVCGNIWPAG